MDNTHPAHTAARPRRNVSRRVGGCLALLSLVACSAPTAARDDGPHDAGQDAHAQPDVALDVPAADVVDVATVPEASVDATPDLPAPTGDARVIQLVVGAQHTCAL